MNLQSRAWRLKNLYAIKNNVGRVVKFVPNEAQIHYYNALHTCNHILKARKLGFSTFNMIDALDAMLFTPGSDVGIIDNTLPDAKKKLAMILLAYQHLDDEKLHGRDHAALMHAIKRATPIRNTTQDITLGNGATAYAGTSLRGSTPTRLYISELGKTAIKSPVKAHEIKDGALNAIVPGNLVTIESTHEGGKNGMHYDLLQVAMANDPHNLSEIDFKFHFFPWWLDPTYELHDNKPIRPRTIEYFERLAPQLPAFCLQHGFTYRPLTHAKMRWYDDKEKTQREAMFKEFPSLPGEAFEAPGEGSIYGKWFYDLRAGRRIIDFEPSRNRPLFTFWDLGMSDSTAIWLVQFDGPSVMFCNWFEDSGQGIGHYANVLRNWQTHYGQTIARHYLPHDANNRDRASGKTYVAELAALGFNNVTVVPRTKDIWHGINAVRDLLPNSYFHATHCDTERKHEGQTLPSGVGCLEGYHKNVSRNGIVIETNPVHDHYSHTADAARTLGDAHRLGLIDKNISPHTTEQTQVRIIRPTLRR